LRALSVNLDHIATLARVRNTRYPALTTAAGICEIAGADGITLHLRGDRRHIQDRDVALIKETSLLPLTLEMGATQEMVKIASRIKPCTVTLVPERPEELTTEGGLNIKEYRDHLSTVTGELKKNKIRVCLFLEPDPDHVVLAREIGAECIELHTGRYAQLGEDGEYEERSLEFDRILKAVEEGRRLGIIMNAGHGLHYQNVEPLAEIKDISEFSIGHGIVCRAVMTGLQNAVTEMVKQIRLPRT